jgi:hypothetical protein
MKTLHSPGPWPITPLPENTWHVTAHVGPIEKPVAMVHGEANARLVAASPDLLAALQDLVFATAHVEGGIALAARKQARAAIAAAKGASL